MDLAKARHGCWLSIIPHETIKVTEKKSGEIYEKLI
jgi:hypothetical protein